MAAMVWALVARGDEDEALLVAERALRVSGNRLPRRAGPRAARDGGRARERHPERAIVPLERALDVADRLGNARYRATVMQFLGAARALSGDVDDGRRSSRGPSRWRATSTTATWRRSRCSTSPAVRGDGRRAARRTAELALAHSRDGNFRHHLADALAVLGELDLAEGEVPAAVARLESSVAVWRTRGWIPYLARTLRSLGDAHAAAADHEAAQAAWAEARELFAGISDDAGRSSVEDRLTHAGITA